MTFREIARKNLRHNIRKFASYFLVNVFVVCVLFLFGSLLFNAVLMADPSMRAVRGFIRAATAGMTAFSVVFLIYTGMYFIRSRGREFGVYLTLGMTARDLSRMIMVEITIIFVGAALLGVGAALLLGHLFYLVLARVLNMDAHLFYLGYRVFLFSLGTLGGIFIVQRGMTAVFIRRLSIIKILQANKTKDKARQRPVVGLVSSILFVVSGLLLHAGMIVDSWATPIFTWLLNALGGNNGVLFILMAGIFFVSAFFMIGSFIAGVAAVCKLFPALYNRHILLFAGLTHKLRAYRTTLYGMALLSAFALFFIGAFMAITMNLANDIDNYLPFDFTVDRRAGLNQVSEYELRHMVQSAGGEIAKMRTLPYVDAVFYWHLTYAHDMHRYAHWLPLEKSMLVSLSDFNQFTGGAFTLAPGEILLARNAQPRHGVADVWVMVETPTLGFAHEADGLTEWHQFWGLMNIPNLQEHFQARTEAPLTLHFGDNFTQMHKSVINARAVDVFDVILMGVVEDTLFTYLTAQRGRTLNSVVTFDLGYGDPYAVMNALVAGLAAANDMPAYVWDTPEPAQFARLRPLSRLERAEMVLRANGIIFFIISTLGVLFLVSSVMVLYHKFVADMDEEAENIALFKKIGLTRRECRRYISAHLGVVFFLPLLVGGIPALFLISQIWMFQQMTLAQMWPYYSRVVLMYGGVLAFNGVLYVALRKRFFRAMRVLDARY